MAIPPMSWDHVIEAWNFQAAGPYHFASFRKGSAWRDVALFGHEAFKSEELARQYLLDDHDRDLYWCPNAFSQPRRRESAVLPGRLLYADLDEADPEKAPVRPVMAWETSPGRHQALWLLDRDLPPAELARLNRKLTYACGADKSGWDLTQVLRVPGTKNHKRGEPAQGRLLWCNWGAANGPHVFDALKDPPPLTADGASFAALVAKWAPQLPPKVSRTLQYPPDLSKADRSKALWWLESEMVKAKLPMEVVVELVRLSPWNKYRGRADEMRRITAEVGKAHSKATSEPEVLSHAEELPVRSLAQVMTGLDSKPGWLVEGLWLRGSHGIVAGQPKTLKSTVTMDLAVSVASGVPLWGQHKVPKPGGVLVVQNENADWIVKDRLEKILASKGLVGEVQMEGSSLRVRFPKDLPMWFLNGAGFKLDDREMMAKLDATVERLKPELVILDPLYLMFGGEINSAKELGPVLDELLALRWRRGCAVMVVHHWGKTSLSHQGGQRMLGSTTLHGWVESALYLEHAGDGKIKVERELRSSTGMLPKLLLEVDMGEVGDPKYVVRESEEGSPAELEAIVAAGPVNVAQAAELLGVHWSTVKRLAEKSGKINVLPGKTKDGKAKALWLSKKG